MKGLFVSSSGIAYPEDMEILRAVLNRFCKDHHVSGDGHEAAEIARTIISLFQAGLCDEPRIRAALDGMEDGTLSRPTKRPAKLIDCGRRLDKAVAFLIALGTFAAGDSREAFLRARSHAPVTGFYGFIISPSNGASILSVAAPDPLLNCRLICTSGAAAR
jgi:hypothetical protein